MGRVGQQACAKCTHNCRLFHQTEQTSFFKVIASQDYFTTLRIPPAFSRTVPDLVNKEIILNDSSGKHWTVKVSRTHGSLAFMGGWDGFSLDHGLKVGYLLVFNYIQDLHFDVKIYDTSACEKLDFSKQRTQKKRIRGRSGSPVKDDKLVRQGPNALVDPKLHGPKMKNQHNKVDSVVTQNGKESGQSMFLEQHEDPCYPTSLEFDQSHGVDGTMKIANRDSKVSNVDYGIHRDQDDAILCTKDTMFEVGRAALDISELEMYGRNASPCEANKSTHDKILTSSLKTNKKFKAVMSNREVQEYQFAEASENDQAAISEREHALHVDEPKKLPLGMTPKLCSSMDELNATGEKTKKLKEELVPLDGLEATTGLPNETMGELGHGSDMFNQDNESPFKTTPTPSCVVPNDNACLKLSTSLPLPGKVKQHDKKMLVLLRDPQRRLWPVLYHEGLHLKLLGHGWLDFSRANNIQPEDEFIFEVEPEAENKTKRINVLDVRIVRQ